MDKVDINLYLQKAEEALNLGDIRGAGILINQVLKKEFTNHEAWQLLHRLRNSKEPLETFQLEFARQYYPDHVHLLTPQMEESSPPVLDIPASTPPVVVVCPQCSAPRIEDHRFCPYCSYDFNLIVISNKKVTEQNITINPPPISPQVVEVKVVNKPERRRKPLVNFLSRYGMIIIGLIMVVIGVILTTMAGSMFRQAQVEWYSGTVRSYNHLRDTGDLLRILGTYIFGGLGLIITLVGLIRAFVLKK